MNETHAGATDAPAQTGMLHGLEFGRSDLLFGLGSAALVAITMANDEDLQQHVVDADPPDWELFGSPAFLAPAALVLWATGKLTHHDALTASTTRGAIAVTTAGIVTVGLKEVCGRSRPRETGDPYQFDPFSGHDSFPSGHTTLAFATATALDRETGSMWVPIVAYPTAALVGWSRVADREHWTSDVVAGAAIGYWVANKAEDVLRAKGVGGPVRVAWTPGPGIGRAMVALRF